MELSYFIITVVVILGFLFYRIFRYVLAYLQNIRSYQELDSERELRQNQREEVIDENLKIISDNIFVPVIYQNEKLLT